MPEQTNATLTLLKAASTPSLPSYKGLSRVGSETGCSLLTTAKTQSGPGEGGLCDQAAGSRRAGMLLRVYREKNKPPPGFFSCGSRGKNKDDNNSSWLCGCVGRTQKSKGQRSHPRPTAAALLPAARVSRREWAPSKATEDKM